MERRGVADDVPLAAALDLGRGTQEFQARMYARHKATSDITHLVHNDRL